MKTQVLSVEQMKRLQELGVDTSKASMMYHFWVDKKYKNCFLLSADTATPYDSENVPTFTLQDMLEMIKEVFACHISIYQDEIFLTLQKIEGFVEFEHSSDYLIECAYEALCWCAKNNYIGGKK